MMNCTKCKNYKQINISGMGKCLKKNINLYDSILIDTSSCFSVKFSINNNKDVDLSSVKLKLVNYKNKKVMNRRLTNEQLEGVLKIINCEPKRP